MKLKKSLLFSIIVFALTVVITCSLVIQNVGSVNQILFPMVTAIVDSSDGMEEWERISFNAQKDLTYDSIFWRKEITNDANSAGNILMRVKDINGEIVVNEFQITPGKSAKLEGLKNGKKYFFEIKAEKGRFFINAT